MKLNIVKIKLFVLRMFGKNCTSRYLVLILTLVCITYVLLSSLATRGLILRDPGSAHSGVLRFDASLEEKTPYALDIHVVEEHHEVIPHWFSAAERNIIPKGGNTLIHIDGHSDMAPPDFFKHFPFFTWPDGPDKYKFLMQENDMFIVSAAITGLISKIVWIWPNWDRPNHEDRVSHQKIEVGWASTKSNVKGITSKVFCMCTLNRTTCEPECNRLDREAREANEMELRIDPGECHIQRALVYEEIREKEAVVELSRSLAFLGGGEIMLDIDEDYYGCTYAIRPLLDSGIKKEITEYIDDFIGNLFCPRNASEELQTDRLLVALLRDMNQLNCKRNGKSLNGKPCYNKVSLRNIRQIYLKKIFTENRHFLCKKIQNISVEAATIRRLIQLFSLLKNKQNKALQYVGFCFTTTPLTFALTSDSKFQICHGANTPNDSAVLEHKTNVTEIQRRSANLNEILSVLKPKKPKIVTLCRSVRDGYTPREHFTRIEHDVINALHHTFDDVNVVYDSGLLGGQRGWPTRS